MALIDIAMDRVFPLTSLFVALSLLGAPCQAFGTDHRKAAQGSSSAADVYYMTEMTDRFGAFTAKHAGSAGRAHLDAQAMLEAAIRDARSVSDKSILEEAAVGNEESRIETHNAFSEMTNFVTTLKYALGATGGVASCDMLSCGEHAHCGMDEALEVASCQCNEGYEGNGFVCKTPVNFRARSLIDITANETPPRVADIHVAALGAGRLAVVYRDTSRGNGGYLMLGEVGSSKVEWGKPVLFSNASQAFGPVVAGLGDGGVAIAFRDQDRGGEAMLVAGRVADAAPSMVSFSPGRAFARNQAQKMVILPMPDSHVAVLLSEHVLSGVSGALTGGAMYGTGVLAQVPKDGSPPDVVAKHRFASGPVARIDATLISPTSFVVAFRQGFNGRGSEKTEASCMFAQVRGSELIFEPHSVSLEPGLSQIWARSVAPVQENTFAYTYHSGGEQVTKQAIVRVDPVTHKMSLLQQPVVIANGFSSFAGTVSAAFMTRQTSKLTLLQERAPRLFSYFARQGGGARARLCKVGGDGVPAACRELEWAGADLSSVSGVAVGDGRLALVFADARGQPRYQLVGLLESEEAE